MDEILDQKSFCRGRNSDTEGHQSRSKDTSTATSQVSSSVSSVIYPGCSIHIYVFQLYISLRDQYIKLILFKPRNDRGSPHCRHLMAWVAASQSRRLARRVWLTQYRVYGTTFAIMETGGTWT